MLPNSIFVFFAYAVQVALADRPPFALSLRAKAGDISSSVEANPVVTASRLLANFRGSKSFIFF